MRHWWGLMILWQTGAAGPLFTADGRPQAPGSASTGRSNLGVGHGLRQWPFGRGAAVRLEEGRQMLVVLQRGCSARLRTRDRRDGLELLQSAVGHEGGEGRGLQ